MTRSLIIAEDRAAFDAAERLTPGQVVLSPVPLEPHGEGTAAAYRSTEYSELVSRRPMYLGVLLSLGHRVLYSDVDTVWLEDIRPLINGPFEVWAAADAQGPTDDQMHMLCTGLLALDPTPRAAALIADWEYLVRTRRPSINQPVFNMAARAGMTDGLRVRPLSHARFPSGAIAFHYPEWLRSQPGQPAFVHSNFVVGDGAKRQRLAELGYWLPETS